MPAPACASWASDGNPLVGSASAPAWPLVVPDAGGGVFLAWVDARSGYNTDVRATRWRADGEPAAGWARDGDLVTNITCAKYDLCATGDGAGGCLFAWGDNRCVGYQQVYVGRVGAAGVAAAGWAANGVPVAATTRNQLTPAISDDGSGGAYVAWQDLRGTDADIYLQHVDGTGAVVGGWPSGGRGVAVAPGLQSAPVLTGDGSGGVFVVWQDRRAGTDDIYVQHMTGAGTVAVGWIVNGVAACAAPGDQRTPGVAFDDAGGILITWQDHRATDWDVYALRMRGNAQLASGWSTNGTALCALTGDQTAVRLTADGAGGAYVAWQDHRGVDQDVYALHIASNASVVSGWTAGGLALATGTADQMTPDLARDPTGGLYLAWQDSRLGNADIRALHVGSNGVLAAGWSVNGSVLCSANADQVAPRIATSGADAFVLWQDVRAGGALPALFAQRLLPDGPVPVSPSALTALHHDGQTFLTWVAPPDTGWTHRVYYRPTPILTDADLATATLIGSVRDSSATDRRLTTLLGALCTFRPDSAAAPLAPAQGLFVVTPSASRQGCYAVTSQAPRGPEDRHVVAGGNSLVTPVTELLALPRPVFQRKLTQGNDTSDVYTLWTWPVDTPLFPAMCNRASWPYDCGVTRGAVAGPAFVRMHQRGGAFTNALLVTGSSDEWVLGLDDYTLNTDIQTYWYGYHPGYDFTTNTNLPPTSGAVIDYTQRRVLYTIQWWRRTFGFDTTRHYAFGYSLGGSASMQLAFQHPELVAAAMSVVGKVNFSLENDPEPLSAFNSGMEFRTSLQRLWGTTSANLESSAGLPLYAAVNNDSLIARSRGTDGAFVMNFAGRHDVIVGWTEKRGFYSALENYRRGGVQFWDDRDHAGTEHPGAMAPMLDPRYLYRFRSNLSWPAFSRCSASGDPGGFTATSGDSIGSLNGYMDWDPAVTDVADQWQATLSTRSLSTLWGALQAPESLSVDVTPRRVQRFKPNAGTTVTYLVKRLSDGAQVQQGVTTVDAQGLVTVPAVRTYRSGTRLTIFTAAALGADPPAPRTRCLYLAPFTNPVRAKATLHLTWPRSGAARLTLYDAAGRNVRVLLAGDAMAGEWSKSLDGSGLAPGVYVLRAEQGGEHLQRRLVLLR